MLSEVLDRSVLDKKGDAEPPEGSEEEMDEKTV